MYHADTHDTVHRLEGVPQSSVGAPLPVVLADGHSVVVAYLMDTTPEGWDGSTPPRGVTPESSDEKIVVVTFTGCLAHFMGPPNDEAFDGHPLASRGLAPYGSFEIKGSSWIREMERRNEVHRDHRGGWLDCWRHFALTFHDEVFECVARSFSAEVAMGSVASVVPSMAARLWTRR